MNEDTFKEKLIARMGRLNEFIRKLEDFAKENGINIREDKAYIVAKAQRKALRDLYP